MLSSGRKTRRTLEAALDWSYQLLSADEQQVLRSLGVFVDGFDLDEYSIEIARRGSR